MLACLLTRFPLKIIICLQLHHLIFKFSAIIQDKAASQKEIKIVNQSFLLHLAGALECSYTKSHYGEVPRWGVSNRARHNWKCFLAYFFFKLFKNFFLNFILCQKCFHHLQCFLKKKFCPWKHEKTGLKSCRTGLNPAQISIPVPYKSPTARLLYNDFAWKHKPCTIWGPPV